MTSDIQSKDNPLPELSPTSELRRFDRFIGSRKLSDNLVGSDEQTIKGEATYEWLPGGFFLQQHVQLDFAGFAQIESYEMISYDPETRTFPSTVSSKMSPEPLPYRWRIDGDTGEDHGHASAARGYLCGQVERSTPPSLVAGD